jgi:hypothetical protein
MCRRLAAILEAHVEGMKPEELLWPCASENKPRMKKRFYAFWSEAAAKAGLPKDMRPHDCRLTHINIVEKHMPEVSQTTLKEHVGRAATGSPKPTTPVLFELTGDTQARTRSSFQISQSRLRLVKPVWRIGGRASIADLTKFRGFRYDLIHG